MDLRGYPQMFKFKGHDIKSRAGSWNGLSTVGNPGSTRSQKFVFDEKRSIMSTGFLIDRSAY
ncbi:G-type lectin S-receptor serine/threonine-protein kinase [Spatholobus suberectus]|nr:G-type lectin S-receptor serine/threonine-protein kinase [Spatholobus suberectus]